MRIMNDTTKFDIILLFATHSKYLWDSKNNNINLNNGKQLQTSEMRDSTRTLLILGDAQQCMLQRLQISSNRNGYFSPFSAVFGMVWWPIAISSPILRIYTCILGKKLCKMYSSLSLFLKCLWINVKFMSEQRYSERIRPSDSSSPEYFFTSVALMYRLLYPN